MSTHVIHEDHTHVHGPDCGHEAVQHGDHVDYLHDGHLHHVHEDHVDEHCACCESCGDTCATCTCENCTCPACTHD